MIWKQEFNLEEINKVRVDSLVNHLAIVFTGFGDDYLEAEMPVDHRTIQPYGILHGGASVALAETLGSIASGLCLKADSNLVPVGIEINANHLKSVTGGKVIGRVTPIRVGKSMHVWNIEIRNEEGTLTCVSRLTTMIINKR
ncbi:hotdog fold thioesterase [Portibacter lacus]|uniref:Esterase n=1 Tax=Portibacter lacus TaxID=1099794 RepID=A0AA37SJA5_9BACT|nr:hotdog fold thioesterase [Portibacter lacus]GLR15511.1 putative esterase [Portibacter lacus]